MAEGWAGTRVAACDHRVVAGAGQVRVQGNIGGPHSQVGRRHHVQQSPGGHLHMHHAGVSPTSSRLGGQMQRRVDINCSATI